MILLLNVSPKGEKSNSYYFLNLLRERLKEECAYAEIQEIKDAMILGVKMSEADAVVIGMPTYVDAVPAAMLKLMEDLCVEFEGVFKDLPIYIIANGGFYESAQIQILLSIMKNWCVRMQMHYCGGLAIGAGEMLSGLSQIPGWEKMNQNLFDGVECLTWAVSEKCPIADFYTEAPSGCTKTTYMVGAHMRWNRIAKKNSVSRRAMYKRVPRAEVCGG